jgi:serralysin
LLFGAKWGGAVGTAVTVEYSFPADGAVWTVNYGQGSEPYSGFVPLTPTQQNAARKALQCWDEVCNITFVEVAESSTNVGVLRFGNSDVPQTAWAYYPTVNPVGGDVWFGKNYNYGSDVEGTYSFATFMHEIGHAIGLKHPHDPFGSGVVLPESVDYLGNSIMSYRSYVGQPVNSGYSNSFFPTTPGIFDIATAQYLYGADTTTRVGNTTYSWSPGEQLFETIWDAGGVDTIDWSNQSTSGIIRLTSGAWSKIGPGYNTGIGYLTNTLNIAYGCTIENARGGSAGDTIYGNTVANVISGNGGNDSCYGDSGNDTLNGNDGNDFLSGQNGNDRLVGGRGKDTLNGGSGNDIYDFNSASESAVGSNRDVVQSFLNPGSLTGDRFDLFDIDANVGVSGNQAFIWRGTGAFTGAGQLRVYNSDSNTIIAGSTDSDFFAEFEIAITDGTFVASNYVAADFIL